MPAPCQVALGEFRDRGCRASRVCDILRAVAPGDLPRHCKRPPPLTALVLRIDTVINIYTRAVIVHVVLSWLVAFRVVNTQNRFVYMVGDFLYRITEPVLRPIRKILPNLGGIDIAPIVLLLLLFFLRNLVICDMFGACF